jgi:glucose-6-phosphate 1-epimerase
MDLESLTEAFAIPGVLAFDLHEGLIRAQVTTPACTATLYLHGAHLTHWQPAGQRPVLFLSGHSDFAPGKAIRGGIPICFPWFGPRTLPITGNTTEGPSHGFARTQTWELAFAALAGDELHLTVTLGPSEQTRALGFEGFRAVYELTLGAELTLKLTVANTGDAPLVFEEALHTYLAVSDATAVTIHGLESAPYLDKTDGMKPKVMPAEPFRFTGVTDRTLNGTSATCVLEDPGYARTIAIAKSGSNTTVVWNPFAEVAAKLADLTPGSWQRFCCIETANAGTDAITLAPTQTHTLQATIAIL